MLGISLYSLEQKIAAGKGVSHAQLLDAFRVESRSLQISRAARAHRDLLLRPEFTRSQLAPELGARAHHQFVELIEAALIGDDGDGLSCARVLQAQIETDLIAARATK